ncbi:MAG: Crp/Fnr family transcriptional regulator [Pseudonocardiales bacterium]|nr:Crp/Fnr family transcriptional regulator [Pseudonocardiales bacterium]
MEHQAAGGQGFGAQLTQQERNDLFRQGRPHRLPAGALLFLEATRSERVEVVISGQVKVFHTAEDGTEVFLAVRGPGDLVGEFAAIDGQPHSASVSAMEPVEVVTIKVPDFTAFLQAHPRIMWLLLRTLTGRLRDADRKRAEFGVYDTLARVACRLVELADRFGEPTESGVRITLRLTREELASWIGASREAVTKALQRLRAGGCIQTEHRKIIVIDIERLRRLIR